jgi:hypothetical protein
MLSVLLLWTIFTPLGHESNRIGNDEYRDMTCSRVTIVNLMIVK